MAKKAMLFPTKNILRLILDIKELNSVGLNGVFAVISIVALRRIEKNVLRYNKGIKKDNHNRDTRPN